MKFEQIQSGSAGNIYLLSNDDGQCVLLEPGTRWPVIEEALGYDLSKVDFCLVTHEHQDHAKSIKNVLDSGIKVYASEGTHIACGTEHERNSEILTSNVNTWIYGWQVLPFAVHHDATEPQGFVIGWGEERVLFITDTYKVTQKFNGAFDVIAIECSYDRDIVNKRVENDSLNRTYANRLITSHLEKNACMRYLSEFCDLSKSPEIHLIHMSNKNINKVETVREFERELNLEVFICE